MDMQSPPSKADPLLHTLHLPRHPSQRAGAWLPSPPPPAPVLARGRWLCREEKSLHFVPSITSLVPIFILPLQDVWEAPCFPWLSY